MLSNTATPVYYGRFREAVLRGEIPICKEIEMEMHRVDDLIANPNVYYDDHGLDGFIKFCEREMCLRDGAPLQLLETFKLWAEPLFCWFYYETRTVPIPDPNGYGTKIVTVRKKRRLIHKQYLIVARGAAKTLYAALLQAYFLLVNTSTTQQITVAPTKRQSDEVMSYIKTAMTRKHGPLMKFMTEGSMQNTTGNKANRPQLFPSRESIVNALTESKLEVRPLSIDKLQGLGCRIATLDEWLSGDIREDPIGAIEQGAAKNSDYIIVAISSEGTIRNGIGDTIKMELMDILRGDYYNPHVSIWYYKLDNIDEVGNPDAWTKANPNIPYLPNLYSAYQEDVERAEHEPSARNDILAKRFGLPMEGFTYFFTYEETLAERRPSTYWNMQCAMGADLSQGDDFCAFSFLFPLGSGHFGIKTLDYITTATLYALPSATRELYESFMQEGSLRVLEGTVLDMDDVYDDLERYIAENGYDIICFGYDPYNARAFVERWARENSPFGLEKVIQGKKTESVPLGELKNLAGKKMLHFDQRLMQWAMGNCIAIEDVNGNRMLLKRRHQDKIDAVAATMDAYIAYKLNKEAFG